MENQVLGGAHHLYETQKCIVWLLEINCRDHDGVYETESTVFLTAFAVSRDGLLMTCAHGGNWIDTAEEIKARPLYGIEPGYKYVAKVELSRPEGDMCLVRLQGVVTLSVGRWGCGDLNVGDKLMLIANPTPFIGSGVIGYVSYPCRDDCGFTFQNTVKCKNYTSNSHNETPTHRIVGHVWNMDTLGLNNDSEDSDTDGVEEDVKEGEGMSDLQLQALNFKKNSMANVPIIQLSSLTCGVGASGGPLFDGKGEIVGMLTGEIAKHQIGIHVSALKLFLEEAISKQSKKGKGNQKRRRY